MHRSLNVLLDEYCDSLLRTRQLKTKARNRGPDGKDDVSQLTGMENSLSWAIEYMVTGYMPMYSEGPYKNSIPTDPQQVLSRYSNEVIRKTVNEQKIEAVLDILDKLTDKERDCIMCVWGEGFSYGETASILKIPKSTVYRNCMTAKDKLGKIEVEQYRVQEVNNHDR